MEQLSGTVFNTATLPNFVNADELAAKLRKTFNLPVTAKYLREMALSGCCPAFFMKSDLSLPLFVQKDVVEWLRETQFYRPRQIPTVEVIVNGPSEAADPARIPATLGQVEGLLEYVICEDPCVYFLIRDNVVVYVGQSITLAARLRQHTDKTFDRVLFLRVPKSQLLTVERKFIVALKPEYNKEKIAEPNETP
jgi:hypothetical protein